jgi:hypothetical protein
MNSCDSYDWDGITYYSTGLYTNNYININGCDSTATLNLTINYSSTSDTSVTACDTYLWNGITYNVSGVYDTVLINSSGCDSTATLNLTINNSSTSTRADTCFGGSDGSLSVDAINGTSPYSYMWSTISNNKI